MTKPQNPNPQPTTGVGNDSYLVPRSKTPAKQRIYEWLLDNGWRYDSAYVEWYTPEEWTLQGKGRLEWAPDFSWARLRAPSRMVNGVPHGGEILLEIPVEDFATSTS